MLRWITVFAVAMVVGSLSPLSGCDSQSCTEAGCDHMATVTLPAGAVSGAYDLLLEFEGMDTVSARCSDSAAPETADNPDGIACDGSTFTLEGTEAAARTVFVTITDPDSGDAIVPRTEVRLEAVDELRPNGPDCPPVCFVRNGDLKL